MVLVASYAKRGHKMVKVASYAKRGHKMVYGKTITEWL